MKYVIVTFLKILNNLLGRTSHLINCIQGHKLLLHILLLKWIWLAKTTEKNTDKYRNRRLADICEVDTLTICMVNLLSIAIQDIGRAKLACQLPSKLERKFLYFFFIFSMNEQSLKVFNVTATRPSWVHIYKLTWRYDYSKFFSIKHNICNCES